MNIHTALRAYYMRLAMYVTFGNRCYAVLRKVFDSSIFTHTQTIPTIRFLKDALRFNTGSATSTRRSSLSSSLMPEVVVTKVTTQRSADTDEGKESPMGPEDENKLQAPDKGGRIWNLLPVSLQNTAQRNPKKTNKNWSVCLEP